MANGYNNNVGYKGNGAKTVTRSAAVKNSKEKQVPALLMSFSTGSLQDGTNESTLLTGLFEHVSKAGNTYFSVSVKEDITIPAGSILMINKYTPKA